MYERHVPYDEVYSVSKHLIAGARTCRAEQQFMPREMYEVPEDSGRVRDTRLVPQKKHTAITITSSESEGQHCGHSTPHSTQPTELPVTKETPRAKDTRNDEKTARIYKNLLSYLRRGSRKKFTFSGDPLKFQAFKVNYTYNTHDLETAVEKFEYLYSIVTGDAEKLCKKFCSHSNPDDALIKLWKSYERRYGTVKSSVDSLLCEISQKAVVELSAKGLRTLLDDLTTCEAEAIMTKLEALDNHHFFDTFATRLPSNLRACLFTKIAELTSTQS